MSKTTLTLLISGLLITSQACTPSVPPLDPNFINTAIALTDSAALTQTAQFAIPVTGPTMTKAPSATPFPSFTPVALGTPELRVSADTDCRTGPGDIYSRVRVLRVGEIAEVVGRSADSTFWVIRNPDRPDETCWISGARATFTGLAGIVPVFTPPPTPTSTRVTVLSTFTPTRTRVPTSTPTRTFTPTLAPALTSTPTSTFLPTATSTNTPTFTPTSSTPTTSPTVTATLSGTPASSTPTASSTVTATLSGTPASSTPTTTSTSTSTPSATPTFSPTPTSTPTSTLTSTATSTSSATSTPLPGFSASYSGLDSCAGTGWWVELALANTGGISFESILVVLTDAATGTVLQLSSEDFINRNGCSTTDTQTNLPPGVTRIVSMPVFSYDPTGHSLGATVLLCSNPGRSGLCLSQAVNFTP